jgi:23S rRNA pseudouridine1911/1915/1917 synthase
VARRGWPARTEIVRRSAGGGVTLVEATLRRGVTHQVRAHLALLGHPVLGDALYGGPDVGLGPSRHALHARGLSPGGRIVDMPCVESAFPDDLRALVS